MNEFSKKLLDGCSRITVISNAPINLLDSRSVVTPPIFSAGSARVSINDVRYDYSLSGNFLASARGVSSSGDVPPACSRSTTWVR